MDGWMDLPCEPTASAELKSVVQKSISIRFS